MTSVMLADADTDLGLAPTKKIAAARAKAHANETRKPVTLRDPVSDELLRTVKPAAKGKAKATTAKPKAKAAKAKAKATKPAAKAKATAKPTTERKPRGRVAEILKLASRKRLASRVERAHRVAWCPLAVAFLKPKKERLLRPLGLQVQGRPGRRLHEIHGHREVTLPQLFDP